MLALVLPALLSAFPLPALSAAAALDRDIMASVCRHGLQPSGDHDRQHDASHDHCVLCGPACTGCGPGLDAVVPAFAARPPVIGSSAPAAPRALAPPLRALLDASPPRGPPTFA